MNKLKILSPITLFSILVIFVVLVLSTKGSSVPATPENMLTTLREETMPFELSPERGRYALVDSIVDNRSVYFSKEIAKYILPDLGFYNDKYVSLFPPGTSIIAIPFYYLGKISGYPQYFAFLTSSFFAFLSCLVIYEIANILTKNQSISIISSLTYLFGTTAFAYSTTLYQHHIVSFSLILGILLLLDDEKIMNTFAIWTLGGLLFFVEYQALIFYLPVMVTNTLQNMIITKEQQNLRIKINNIIFIGVVGFLISLTPFFYYNMITYGKFYQLAGTVQSSKTVSEDPETGELILPRSENIQEASGFFHIYKLPNSVSVLLTSTDRGVIYFSPVIIFSIFGLVPLYRKNKELAVTIILMILSIILLYGMWGDPWGGWAFGTRYLIPAFALMSIPIGMALNKYGKKWYFALPFTLVFFYSVFINLNGALTTNQIPPSIEVESQKYPYYTFIHNVNLAMEGKTSSFIYKTFLSDIDFRIFFFSIYALIVVVLIINYYLFFIDHRQKDD